MGRVESDVEQFACGGGPDWLFVLLGGGALLYVSAARNSSSPHTPISVITHNQANPCSHQAHSFCVGKGGMSEPAATKPPCKSDKIHVTLSFHWLV